MSSPKLSAAEMDNLLEQRAGRHPRNKIQRAHSCTVFKHKLEHTFLSLGQGFNKKMSVFRETSKTKWQIIFHLYQRVIQRCNLLRSTPILQLICSKLVQNRGPCECKQIGQIQVCNFGWLLQALLSCPQERGQSVRTRDLTDTAIFAPSLVAFFLFSRLSSFINKDGDLRGV